MFSSPRRWSPGRSGGETSRNKILTSSPSRLAKSTPSFERATGRDQPIDGRMFRMRDGHAHPDAGGAELFTLQDRRDDALLVFGADGAALPQALHQCPNCRLFQGRGLQFGQDAF